MCQEFLVDMNSKYRNFLNVIYVVDDRESAKGEDGISSYEDP